MNHYEFISDRYASLCAEHHFDGFALRKIPLIRKLDWREIVSAKELYSDIFQMKIKRFWLMTRLFQTYATLLTWKQALVLKIFLSSYELMRFGV